MRCPGSIPKGKGSASPQPLRWANVAASTTTSPAASVAPMVEGRLRSSPSKMGLAPRPSSNARANAAAPSGPSVSPFGSQGGVPAPVTTST